MRSASQLVSEFRSRGNVETDQAVSHIHRYRRATAALSLALLTIVPAMIIFGGNVSSVLAWDDQNPTAYWQAERARQQRSRAVSRQPARLAYAPAPAHTNPLLAIFNPGKKAAVGKTANGKHESQDMLPSKEDPLNATSEFAPSPSRIPASGQAVCVRLCDGFYFPVGNSPAPGEAATRESVCNALCPGAPTRLYVLPHGTDDINQAYSPRGERSYAALPVAFRHTQTFDKTCSCRPQGQPHASLVSITRDFTLRKGDAIMTKQGFRVFRGAARWPYRPHDFTTLAQARNFSREERAKLREIERISMIKPGQHTLASPAFAISANLPAIGPMPPRRPDFRASLNPAARR